MVVCLGRARIGRTERVAPPDPSGAGAGPLRAGGREALGGAQARQAPRRAADAAPGGRRGERAHALLQQRDDVGGRGERVGDDAAVGQGGGGDRAAVDEGEHGGGLHGAGGGERGGLAPDPGAVGGGGGGGGGAGRGSWGMGAPKGGGGPPGGGGGGGGGGDGVGGGQGSGVPEGGGGAHRGVGAPARPRPFPRLERRRAHGGHPSQTAILPRCASGHTTATASRCRPAIRSRC